jgi:hypothetical protein
MIDNGAFARRGWGEGDGRPLHAADRIPLRHRTKEERELAASDYAGPQRPRPTSRTIAADKQRGANRLRVACDVCGTLFALILVALAILALRFVLELAHGVLH